MLTSEARNSILYGLSSDLSDDIKKTLSKGIDDVIKYFDDLNDNKSSNKIFASKGNKRTGNDGKADGQFYTNLSNMINNDNRFIDDCSEMLETLAAKNKKYYSVIKDYQIMNILIPQINRVLLFLINECISPDIQNKRTFEIKYTSGDNKEAISEEITTIRDELKLDSKLKQVYEDRFKLGREYNAVIDYSSTYEKSMEMLKNASLSESVNINEAFDNLLSPLVGTINEVSFSITDSCFDETYKNIKETTIDINLSDMNIIIERSAAVGILKDAKDICVSESVSDYSIDNILSNIGFNNNLNEAVFDTNKVLDKNRIAEIIKTLNKKKLDRCVIRHFDPAKMFKLEISGRTIGYFYIEDIDSDKSKYVNVAQGLKDRLLKSRVANINQSFTDAEEIIAKQLAEKIIQTFDPNIGISRIEDIDLFHNYLISSGIANGNKKITFYYQDDIFDMSRTGDSILTNAVFFTKLFATLMLNNVMTKILRGRGRQIHTVNMGASPMTKKYVMNATAALTMPENNLGTLHGSFEQLLNPLNSASDIVILSEDGAEQYIRTDYIEGQNIDMDNDFLRFILNSIITSFGTDPGLLDITNGNVQFAKTLSMESVQICILIMNEQNDLIRPWSKFVLKCLECEGSDALKDAIKSGSVEVKFFTPKSLTLQLMVDEINSAKNNAEAIADVIPLFNSMDDPTIEYMRTEYIFNEICRNTNIDWDTTLASIKDAKVSALDLELQKEILEVIRAYKENTTEQNIDDVNNDGMSDEFGEDEMPVGDMTADEAETDTSTMNPEMDAGEEPVDTETETPPEEPDIDTETPEEPEIPEVGEDEDNEGVPDLPNLDLEDEDLDL